MAVKSSTCKCDVCGPIAELLLKTDGADDGSGDKAEIEKYAAQLSITKPTEDGSTNNNDKSTPAPGYFLAIKV